MADIKTHLRELSVAVTVGLLKNGVSFAKEDLYCSNNFFNYCKTVVSTDISQLHNLREESVYNDELKKIIDNGYSLGKKIIESPEFKIRQSDKIQWLGNDTQKGDPIDLKIGSYSFSLKEESFILKNMGLYSLLNNLTSSNYQRGLHVFSTFAKSEYDNWFEYTWKVFIKELNDNGKWVLKKANDTSVAEIIESKVKLTFNNETSMVPINIKTNEEFMKNTTSKTREKVFSKWINNCVNDDLNYIKLKKLCSEKAGNEVSNTINIRYNAANVYSFFQIYNFPYYYAKTTSTETTILKVPSKDEFNTTIMFIDCRYEVPASQLNIISTFKNEKTGKTLQFRNECRFSHGQFNGTPEAKMYVVRNTPLTELYTPIK